MGCKIVSKDLTFTESYKDCSQNDAGKCLAVANLARALAKASLSPIPTSSAAADVQVNNIMLRDGGDLDTHGCIGSAGFEWCASKQSCIRRWQYGVMTQEDFNRLCGVNSQAIVRNTLSSEFKYGADLVTFDGNKKTSWKWRILNDPVMGGLSKSSFTVNQAGKYGVFNGTVAIVPKLKAPGFCVAETMNGLGVFTRGEDMSSYSHLLMKVRTTTPEYQGFKVSLAADTINPQFYSYKANFLVNATSDWQMVSVPFSSFSNDWSSFTGDCDTTDPNGRKHKCCTPETPEVCIKPKNLRDISQVGIWAEGHAGNFHLEVERIGGGNLA